MKCPNCKKEFRTKTTPQLRYCHDLIEDYLTPVLFDSGNIPSKSPDLAKSWLKRDCGYGETVCFKFKGHPRTDFMEYSFADCSKEQMIQIIDRIAQICAFSGVIIPEPTKDRK